MKKLRKHDLFGIGWAPEEVLVKTDKPREIASVAVLKDGKLLMGKRRDNDRWTMPGGHLNEGEHHHDGAKRELQEEAGLQADTLHYLGSHDLQDFKGKALRVHAYQHKVNEDCATTMQDDPDQEVHRWQWIDISKGLPKEIEDNLHSKKNVTLKLLGLQDWDKMEKSIKEKMELLKTSLSHERIKKISGDVQAGLRLMHTEKDWIQHVTQPGHHVKIDHLPGKVGKVIQGAKDPVNGMGHERMVLVEHEHNKPGSSVQRFYPATSLTPHKPEKK